MPRKNPVAIKGSVKTVPKGARKGQIITRGGKRYRVVSFVNSNGTRVRYLQAITQCSPSAHKPACKKRKIMRKSARKNPFLPSPASTCSLPRDKSKWIPGTRWVDNRGQRCVIQRTRAKGGYVAMAHSALTPSVTGRKKGSRFTFGGQRYIVKTRRTRAGGYKKYAQKVG